MASDERCAELERYFCNTTRTQAYLYDADPSEPDSVSTVCMGFQRHYGVSHSSSTATENLITCIVCCIRNYPKSQFLTRIGADNLKPWDKN